MLWCLDCGQAIEHGYEYDERFPLCKTCCKKRELHDERDAEDEIFTDEEE